MFTARECLRNSRHSFLSFLNFELCRLQKNLRIDNRRCSTTTLRDTFKADTFKVSMNLNTCIDYGGVIKAFKEEHKLRTSDVAEYLGKDHHTVLSWEKCKRMPIYTNWKRVIKKLNEYVETC